MNIKAISRNVGYALLVSALFMLFSVIVSVLNGSDSALAALIISFIITFTVGIFPFIFVKRTTAISLKEGYLIIVLSWLMSFVCGALPYALWGGPFDLTNAWFESVSGFTTTGATILDTVEVIPASLLFWRASTHFIGGLGVVVFLLLIIPTASPIRMRLTNMELSSLSKDAYNSRANKIVYIFAYVYLALVALSFLAYLLAGMTPLDAICHAFSVSATGGFSTRTMSIGYYDSRWIEGITMLFMFLSSIHFGTTFIAIVNRTLKPFNNPILKLYLSLLLVFTLYEATVLTLNGIQPTFGQALWESLFYVLCVSTTTGFATMDNSLWPFAANLPLVFMGVICACAGSTSGGVKVDRILVLFKSIGRHIRGILHPHAVNEVRLGNHVVQPEEAALHLLYIAFYFLMVFVGFAVAIWTGMESDTAFTASIASMGNVGPAIKELGTAGCYSSVPYPAKILFTLEMFMGRIEIYPVLAVVAMMFTRKKKN